MMTRQTIWRVLAVSVLAPIVAATSCPPPRNPTSIIFPPVDDSGTNDDSIPRTCADNIVCFELKNTTIVPVKVAVYLHNGFDPTSKYAPRDAQGNFICDMNGNCQICPGALSGNCVLTFAQLFQTENIFSVQNAQVTNLAPGESVTFSLKCDRVKTFGVAVSPQDGDPIAAPTIIRGPNVKPPCPVTNQSYLVLVRDVNQITVPQFSQFVSLDAAILP